MKDIERLKELAAAGKINPSAGIRDEQSALLNASQSNVWDVFTNPQKWSEMTHEISRASQDRLHLNESFSWHLHGQKCRSQVIRLDAPNLCSFVTKTRWSQMIHVLELEAVSDQQTAITIKASIEARLFLFITKNSRENDILLNWLQGAQRYFEN